MPSESAKRGAAHACLDDEALASLLERGVDPSKDFTVKAHLDDCDACRRLLAAVVMGGSSLSHTARGRSYVPPKKGELVAEKYRVERKLGVGGMGLVLAARHVELGQLVALKLLRPEMMSDEDAVRRFAREAKAAAALRSAHAIRIFDVGRLESGAPFMVMEYLEGRDLASELDETGPMAPAEAIACIVQACDAVGEAHELGIIHRDIKPHNLFLTSGRGLEAFVKVLDFGLAKTVMIAGDGATTATNVVLGSPYFMSPEQITATRHVDRRADIWSLGATLYHLLAGVPPFVAPSVHLVYSKILTEDPPPIGLRVPDVSPELEAIVRRCMRRAPDERYPTVAALAQALGAIASVAPRIAPRASQMSAEEIGRALDAIDPPQTLPMTDTSAPVTIVDRPAAHLPVTERGPVARLAGPAAEAVPAPRPTAVQPASGARPSTRAGTIAAVAALAVLGLAASFGAKEYMSRRAQASDRAPAERSVTEIPGPIATPSETAAASASALEPPVPLPSASASVAPKPPSRAIVNPPRAKASASVVAPPPPPPPPSDPRPAATDRP